MAKRCLGCMELYGDEFQVCPHCGFVEGTLAEEKIHMDPGTMLHDRYLIGRVLGYGGFGVTYLGWDIRLEQKVAIKEYLPSEFSTRMPNHARITVFSGDKSEQFHAGLEKFTEEAKRLAKFTSEDGIVRIFDSFEENETGYIIMEYLKGETLAQYLEREGKIPEDRAIEMLMPVMESLLTIHEKGMLHRDISPDNIFLTEDGGVKLIDFGSSRYSTATHSRSLTVMIKPGFSPEEQYRSRGDQGPHTDVYAIAATLYKMITGTTPPDAMERRAFYENKNKDIFVEPHKLVKEITPSHEVAILNAMNVRVEDRTPDIQTFISELNADVPAKRRAGAIRKIDFYRWPVWLKVLIPSVLGAIVVFLVLLFTGVILPDRFSDTLVVPDGVVRTPDVEGMASEEAVTVIEEANLMAVSAGTVETEYVAAGKVVSQTPAGGMFIQEQGTVELYVSSGSEVQGPVNGISTVPYVISDTREKAAQKLKMAGLGTPEIEEEYDDNVPEGSVIAQSEEYGTEVPEGTVLTLTISLGSKPFDMPDVTGMDSEEAQELLSGQGLIVILEYEQNEDLEDHTVLRQSIRASRQVSRGTEVTLTVATGEETVEVPDAIGDPEAQAVAVLEEAGFVVNVVQNYSDTVEAGIVMNMNPAGGSRQLPGSAVVLYVSRGAQPAQQQNDTAQNEQQQNAQQQNAQQQNAAAQEAVNENVNAANQNAAEPEGNARLTEGQTETTRSSVSTQQTTTQRQTTTSRQAGNTNNAGQTNNSGQQSNSTQSGQTQAQEPEAQTPAATSGQTAPRETAAAPAQTTAAPVTQTPATAAPVTQAPTTAAPVPETPAPAAPEPTTPEPTTPEPTTQARVESDWVESVPAGAEVTQSKTQYSYREIEYTTTSTYYTSNEPYPTPDDIVARHNEMYAQGYGYYGSGGYENLYTEWEDLGWFHSSVYLSNCERFPDLYQYIDVKTENDTEYIYVQARRFYGIVVYSVWYRYTDWSGWSDEPVYASDTCEVQTRTLYKYLQ